MSFGADAYIQWETIAEGVDSAVAIKTLDQRTRDLMVKISRLEQTSADEVAQLDRDIAEEQARVKTLAEGVARDTRRAAIGGIRQEALGLMVAAVGLLLQLSGFTLSLRGAQ